jgi:peptidyl-prolyl cis-trans isomerase C
MNVRRTVPFFLLLAAACATAPRGNPSYLAKVNDEVITGDDLRQEFSRHHAALEKVLGDRPEVEKYLDRLIDRRLFIQEGRAMGIEDMPDVKADLDRYEASEIAKAFLKDNVDAKVTVSDEEVKAAFALLSERIDLRQFVAPTRAEAEAFLAKVSKGGDFEALVRAGSRGQSATRGGMMILRWGADEARENAAAPLKAGEMTLVYQSTEGWEVDRMERRAPYQMMAMDKASNFIRSTMERRKKIAAEEALRASLRAKYDARFQECAPTLEALKAAAGKDDPATCATWKDGQITASDLARAVHVDQLEKVPEAYRKNREAVVEELVDRELVKREAKGLGYAARPEIAAKVKRYQDDLVEAKLFQDWVAKKVDATDEEVKAYYEAHADVFKEPKQFHLAQIVVESPEAAAEVEAKLAAKVPFEDLAAAYTIDKATADRGGYVGALIPAQLTGDFAVVAGLTDGQYSRPIKSERGYHIVKVLTVVPEKQLTFDEAKVQARERLLEERRSAEQQRWVKKLRESATIEVSDAGIVAYQADQLKRLREEAAARAAKAAAAKEAADAAAAKEAAEKEAAEKAKAATPAGATPAPAGAPVPAPPADPKPAAQP